MSNYFYITESVGKQSNAAKIFILLISALFCLVPGPPSDVEVFPFAEYILVTWKPPKEPNGVITGYRVGSAKYVGSQSQDVDVTLEEVGASVRRFLLSDQEELSDYVIEIQAKTEPGWGESLRKTTSTVKMSGKSYNVNVMSFSRKVVPFQQVILEQFSIECCKTKLWKIVELRLFPFDLWPVHEACGT